MTNPNGIGGTDMVCLPSRLHEDDLPGAMLEDDKGFVYLPLTFFTPSPSPRPIGITWATPECVDDDIKRWTELSHLMDDPLYKPEI